MIIIAKGVEDLKKVSTGFLENSFRVFRTTIYDDVKLPVKSYRLNTLVPAELATKFKLGSINKKKFLKKYLKFMQNDLVFETYLFNILKSLKCGNNLCFVCADDKFDWTILKAFARYLEEVAGVKIYRPDDVEDYFKKKIREIAEVDDKKLTKTIIKVILEGEVPSKKMKKRCKPILKVITKQLSKPEKFDAKGEKLYSHLDAKMAVDQIIAASVKDKVIAFNNNSVRILDSEKVKNKKSYINAINYTVNADKEYGKIVKKVFEVNNVKFKEKALKKLSKEQLIMLCAKISQALEKFRTEK